MQIKIFEENGNNETDVNARLKENPQIKVVGVGLSPMYDRFCTGDICNQWIATIVIYGEG